ncbi:MAG: hypothetical protein WEA10_06200 [Actinomycetota bacterium]
MTLPLIATGVGRAFTSGEFDFTPLVAACVMMAAAVGVFRMRPSVPLIVAVLLGGLLWATVAGTYGFALPSVIAAIALLAASRMARDLRRARG